jgi:hypothetical protein
VLRSAKAQSDTLVNGADPLDEGRLEAFTVLVRLFQEARTSPLELCYNCLGPPHSISVPAPTAAKIDD